jgi:hypothetical protein
MAESSSKVARSTLLERTGVSAVAVWCLLCTIVGRAFTSISPGMYDSALFAYIGFQWAHGRVPYIDVWDNKPPGIFATSAVGLSILTRDFKSLAVLEGLVIIGCSIVVVALLRYWQVPRFVYLLAMAAVVAGANLRVIGGSNLTEIYLLFPATLSMYLFARGEGRGSAGCMVAAGFFTGVAMLFKPVGLAPFLAQAAYLLLLAFLWRRLSPGKAFTALLLNAAGIALAWVPALAYFGWHHAARELLNASFFYNVQYGAHTLRQKLLLLPLLIAERLQPLSTLCVFTMVGLLFLPRSFRGEDALPRGTQWHWLLVLVWVFFDLVGAVAGGREYSHYYFALVPSLAVAAAFAVWALRSSLERYSDRRLQYALLLLFLLPLGLTQAADIVATARDVRWHESTSAELIANKINAAARRGDTVFVWPYEPMIYYSTKLVSPGRYLTAHYIYDSSAAYNRIGTEIMASIRRTPPTYLVDCVAWCSKRKLAGTDDPIYMEFRDFVAGNYVPVYRAGDLQLYRNRSVEETVRMKMFSHFR